MRGALVVMLLAVGAPAQTPLSQAAGSISGTVLAQDGRPAANLRVSTAAAEDSSALLTITQTDAAGRFRLDNIRPGRYVVLAGPVDAPTYFPGTNSRNGATVITIAAGQVLTGIDFRMLASSGLRFAGRVIRLDGTGAVVPAAPAGAAGPPFQIIANSPIATTIRLSGGSRPVPPGQGAVAPDGSFQFTNLGPGTYQVMITPASAGMPRPSVTLTDKDITDFQFIVPFMVTVSGTVTVEGGAPVPRFQLTLSDVNPRAPLPGAAPTSIAPVTISVGPTFTAPVPSGDQRVNVGGLISGYTVKSITSGNVDLLRDPLKVTSDMPPIRIVLGIASPSPFVSFTGKVVGQAEWHLLTNFNVNLPTMASPPDVIFYLDGSFEFPMTLTGDHQVRISGPDFASLISVVSAGQINPVINVPSTSLVSTERPSNPGAPGVRVSGRIVGRARASRGVKLRIREVDSGETLATPIFMDGSFEFPRVSPGAYAVTVFPPVPGALPTPLTVGNADMRDVRVTVPNTREISGRVVVEGGGPMPRSLMLSFPIGSPVSLNPRSDGSFRIEIPAEQQVRVVQESIPRGYALISSEVIADELRVRLRSTATASVSGRVTGFSASMSPAFVWLVDGTGIYHTIETAVAADGTFTFRNVPAGVYAAHLTRPGTSRATSPIPVVVGQGNVTGIEIVP